MTPSSSSARWVLRILGVLAVGLGLYAVAARFDLEPDPVVIVLATGLVVAAWSLLVESITPYSPQWFPTVRKDPFTRGRDSATFADLRLLESHQTARDPEPHLHRRLGDLADRALRATHGVGLDSDEGRTRLGPVVTGLLDSGGRRLSPRDIDLCLRTIEEL